MSGMNGAGPKKDPKKNDGLVSWASHEFGCTGCAAVVVAVLSFTVGVGATLLTYWLVSQTG